ETNGHRGKKSHAQGEEENMRIETEIDIAIEDEGRAERPQDGAARISDGQPNRAGEQRKDQTFGEQLPRHAQLAGAESSAKANFSWPAGRLSEKKVGQIGAGDEKHQADNRHHESANERELIVVVDTDSGLGKRSESDAAAGVVLGKLALQIGSDGFER